MKRIPMGTVKKDFEPLPTAGDLVFRAMRHNAVTTRVVVAKFKQAVAEANRDMERGA